MGVISVRAILVHSSCVKCIVTTDLRTIPKAATFVNAILVLLYYAN
jgi:hypothetical protein